jgi:hypothetical protein
MAVAVQNAVIPGADEVREPGIQPQYAKLVIASGFRVRVLRTRPGMTGSQL